MWDQLAHGNDWRGCLLRLRAKALHLAGVCMRVYFRYFIFYVRKIEREERTDDSDCRQTALALHSELRSAISRSTCKPDFLFIMFRSTISI
jgi:hypothetical protein